MSGHPDNRVGSDADGATIAGGGPHQVTADYGTVGGGSANTAAGSFSAVGGGVENQANGSRSVVGGGRANVASGAAATVSGGYTNAAAGDYATVSGGWRNQSTGYVSTIGGGWENIATGQVAVIGGGQYNTALAAAATVSGGWRNRAEGAGAMIPGGRDNIALGEYSLAAGRNANAQHAGTFIWSDSTETGLSSTDINQFLIQAAGNVGIDTDRPHEKLTVAGNIAPAQDGTFTLGTETTRWERIYLSEAVDYPGVFSATSGGATNLQLDQTGNLRVTGAITATQFIGDGSQLTGVQIGDDVLTSLDERYLRSGDTASVPAVAATPADPPPATPSSDAVTVDDEGRVGVGTTTPGARLHVAGQIRIDGGNPGPGKVLTSDESGLATWRTPAAGGAPGAATTTRVIDNEQSPNLISGHTSNTVGEATIGATIGGGGRDGKANRAEGNFTTVGGGMGNEINGNYSTIGGGFDNIVFNSGATIAGGIGNTVSNWNVTVSGGRDNNASGIGATIGGGRGNIATNRYATIPGGYFNTAAGPGAVVGGGLANIADGFIATVPGGSQNEASGEYSMAAGRRAKAMHNGAFVWGDSFDEDIASTTSNQVVFRAEGGVGINTADTPEALNVAGNILTRGIVFTTNLVVSAGGEPLLQLDPQGNLQVSGTIKAAAFDGASLPLTSTGTTTQTDVALAPNAVGSEEIRDGAVQLQDLDLDALDQRYSKAGETVAAAATLPSALVELISSQDGRMNIDGALKATSLAGDGSELTGVTATSLADDAVIQPAQVEGKALTEASVFSGAVSGTASNLVLQDGAVQLQHLDLEAVDARYAKAGETSDIPVVAAAPTIEPGSIGSTELTDGAVQLEDLNLEALDERYAKAGETSAVPVVAAAPTIEPGSIGSSELTDGAVQLEDLNLEALDERYAKAGETSAVPVVAAAPTIEPGSIGSSELTDGAVQLEDLNLEALDQRFVQPDALTAATASALNQDSVFEGAVSGTASNLVLQDGAVQLQHLNLETIDERYVRPDALTAATASVLQDVAGKLQHLDLETMDARYAKAGESPTIELDNLNLEALDNRYVLPEAMAATLTHTTEFDGDVTGTSTNLSVAANSISGNQIQDASIGIADVKIDEFDARYAPAGAVATTNTAAALPQVITPTQVSGIALTQDSSFDGSVAGPSTNLQLQANTVDSDHIRNGAVAVEDLDIESLDARYAALLQSSVPDLLPDPAAMPPALAGALSIQSNGVASFSGTVTADSFEGYGAGLTGVIATHIADGSVANQTIAEDAAIDPGKIAGTALTTATEFAGEVQGPATNLVVSPRSIGPTHVVMKSLGLDSLDSDSLDQRYATVEALADVSGQAPILPSMITSNGLAEGSVHGPAIADGTITLRDVDLAAFDERYPTQEEMNRVLAEKLTATAAPTGVVETAPALKPNSVTADHLQRESTDALYVNRDGDTLSGALTLPADGLSVGEAELVVRDGNVGIGVAEPTAALDIAGSIRIAGGQPGEGKLLVSDHDGAARWAAPEELSLGSETPDAEDVRYGSVFGPRIQQPLNLQVAGKRALRIEPTAVSPNLIGGNEGNTVKPRTTGSTISGGGSPDQPNRVDADYGAIGGGVGNLVEGPYGTIGGGWANVTEGPRSTIGGGRLNAARGAASTVGGGFTNLAHGSYATIAGGYANIADGYVATVGGGWGNNATGTVSTIGGGQDNIASGSGSTVAGGWKNRAEGLGAIIPGGKGNLAKGEFSAALGLRAQALHDGAFVWSDSEDTEFASTGNDQFLIKARGNVGIDDNNPSEKLTVKGNIAPTTHRRFNLGSPTARWEKLYLGSTLDLANPLKITQDGKPILAVSPEGDVNVPGTIIGRQFIGDGSGLKNLPAQEIADGAIALKHLSDDVRAELAKTAATTTVVPTPTSDNTPISPARIQGIAVTRKDRFDGEVTGTFNQLKLRDGTVERKHLSKELVASLDQPSTDRTIVDSLTTTGTVTAARFVGDGSALTGISKPKPAPASITDIHIQPNAGISPAKVKGIAVTRNDQFDGSVTGPYNKLTLRDGAVSMQHLGKDVADAINKPAPKMTNLDPATIKGIALTRDEVFNGVVVGAISNLHYRAQSITAPAIAEGVIAMNHLGTDVVDAINKPAPAVVDLNPSAIKGVAVTRNDQFGGAVTGPFNQLALNEGAVSMQHLGQDVADAINKPAPQVVDLEPSAIKGVAVTRNDQFGGAVTGPFNQLTLNEGAVSMQHLGRDVADAINKPAPAVVDLDPSAVKGIALTRDEVFNGVVVGSISNLQYRAGSVTGPTIAEGAISLRHIAGPLLKELTPKPQDLSRVPELTVDGPLRAKRLEGDGSGLSNIPLSALTIPKAAINADMLAPQSVYVEHLAPGLAELVQREIPDLDRLTDLTLRGNLNARRLSGDGSAITGLQFSALKIPADSISGDLIQPGSIGKKHLAPELAELGASGWLLGGNQTGGSRPAILGTNNDAPLHIQAGGQPILRLRPGATSPILIAGHSSNTIDAGAEGAVISGGGAAGSPNRVAQRYGTVGGGINNQARNEFATVGGGSGNVSAGFDATIAGGQDNQAAGSGSMIGGGFTNVSAGSFSTIAGGAANRAAGNVAAIAGGYGNSASGSHATVPGGSLNEATGDYSLAAGRRAQARHPGSFVWSDGTDTEIASTAANQFVAQASGGVRLVSDTAGRAGVQLLPGSGSWSTLSDRSMKENLAPVDPQQILDAVVALPLNSWNYTTQRPGIRHLGPTAQDFRAAFALGARDTHITGVDAQGVALAAIQGMHQRLTEKDERIHALEDENRALAERIERIEQRLNQPNTAERP